MMDNFPRLELGDFVAAIVGYIIDTFSWFFDGIKLVVTAIYDGVDWVLLAPPFWVIVLVFAAFAFWVRGLGLAIGTTLGLLLIVSLDLWEESMDTLALVLLASAIAAAISVPVGIWAARNDTVSHIVRPILDFLQTMPAFVYLVPALLLFSVGVTPGIVSTIIFAMAPGVRLTELGIRGVDKEVVEAGNAFGATRSRILRQIQLPLAMPSIMAGINQVIMLSLSMVVIAGMVGAGGLGEVVVQGLVRLDLSLGIEAGVSVVVLAMILDRTTGALSTRQQRTRDRRMSKNADERAKQQEPATNPA